VIALDNDPVISVRVDYATRYGRLEVNAGPASSDAVILALAKALYCALAKAVTVQT